MNRCGCSLLRVLLTSAVLATGRAAAAETGVADKAAKAEAKKSAEKAPDVAAAPRMMEDCRHDSSDPDNLAYACVWLLGDGYAQILKSGDTSAALGIGLSYNSFRRPVAARNGLHRIENFAEGSLFFKKGTASIIEGVDPAPFAAMVLDPQGSSFSLDARVRWEPLRTWPVDISDTDTSWGFAAYGSVGSTKWAFGPPGSAPVQATVLAWGIGPSVRVLPDWMTRNFITVTVALFLTQRVVQSSDPAFPAMRNAVFGTTDGGNDHTFTGLEPQIGLRINDVTVTASVPFLSGSANGVSRSNVLMTVSLRTGARLN